MIDAHKKIVRLLNRRRVTDDLSVMNSRLRTHEKIELNTIWTNDPARGDEIWEAQLTENRKLAEDKEQKVDDLFHALVF